MKLPFSFSFLLAFTMAGVIAAAKKNGWGVRKYGNLVSLKKGTRLMEVVMPPLPNWIKGQTNWPVDCHIRSLPATPEEVLNFVRTLKSLRVGNSEIVLPIPVWADPCGEVGEHEMWGTVETVTLPRKEALPKMLEFEIELQTFLNEFLLPIGVRELDPAELKPGELEETPHVWGTLPNETKGRLFIAADEFALVELLNQPWFTVTRSDWF